MRDKFTTKQGKPTAYAYACGYVYNKGGYTLYKIHGVYRVSSYEEIRFFETLREAYKYLAQ